VTRLGGAITTVCPDTIVLAVARTSDAARLTSRWQGQHVAIDRRFVAAVGTRRVSRSRTALFVGLSLAVVAATFGFASGNGHGGGSVPGGVTPPN
jgi:hypothetical protein